MNGPKTGLIVLALMVLASVGVVAQESGGSQAVEIKVTAKKYEYDPNVITVKKGQQVKLVITALDRDHGFKLEAFGIDQRLKKGDPTTIEFKPDKTGEFPFQCSVVCGIGHRKMKGKLVVEE